MNVALYLIGAIVAILLLYGLIGAGLSFLFWTGIALVLLGLTFAAVRHWWLKRKRRATPKQVTEKRLDRDASKALNQLERKLAEEKPEQQRLRH